MNCYFTCQIYQNSLKRALLRRKKLHWPRLIWPTRYSRVLRSLWAMSKSSVFNIHLKALNKLTERVLYVRGLKERWRSNAQGFSRQRKPHLINPLMPTLKLQSNGPLYSNTVTGILAVDGWPVIFGIWYSEEGPGRVADHSSTASVPITVLLYSGPLLCGFTVSIKG